jgi:signal transduction histidine kinase
VAQEALSNVLRHAGTPATTVRLRHETDALTLEVEDEGGPAPAPPRRDGPGGHGLVGMRERVGLFGGRLRTGPRDEGGYQVSATFPLSAAVAG